MCGLRSLYLRMHVFMSSFILILLYNVFYDVFYALYLWCLINYLLTCLFTRYQDIGHTIRIIANEVIFVSVQHINNDVTVTILISFNDQKSIIVLVRISHHTIRFLSGEFTYQRRPYPSCLASSK